MARSPVPLVGEVLRTVRLTLEPVVREHAAQMHRVLADPGLYEFVGGAPPTEPELAERYARLARRRSSDGRELWGNWVLRETASGAAVGYVQATLDADGPSGASRSPALVAWVVGTPWQGRGFAQEAAAALVGRLRSAGWVVAADVHPGHAASQGVARAVGLRPTGEVVDGEIRWSSGPPDLVLG